MSVECVFWSDGRHCYNDNGAAGIVYGGTRRKRCACGAVVNPDPSALGQVEGKEPKSDSGPASTPRDSAPPAAPPETPTCESWCGTTGHPINNGDGPPIWFNMKLTRAQQCIGYCTPACRDAGKPLHPQTPIKTCETCGGSRKVLAPVKDRGRWTEGLKPCPTCAGTGQQPNPNQGSGGPTPEGER